jgi:hypothetical protein
LSSNAYCIKLLYWNFGSLSSYNEHIVYHSSLISTFCFAWRSLTSICPYRPGYSAVFGVGVLREKTRSSVHAASTFSCLLTYLLTYLLTLITCLLTYLFTHLVTYFNYLLTYLLIYSLTYFNYLLTYLLIYSLTYLL